LLSFRVGSGCCPEKAVITVPSVITVPEDRVTEMRHMRADLMRPSCDQLDLDLGYVFSVGTRVFINAKNSIACCDRQVVRTFFVMYEDISACGLFEP